MAIPHNINHNHILTVIDQIDIGRPIPKRRGIQVYFCSYNGNQYPVKLLISWGHEIYNGQEYPSASFITTEAVQYLQNLGFQIGVIQAIN
jgi:hypothetical protein